MLFHISEEPGIRQFEPRVFETASFPVVWAIDAEHVRNYLLPRDCPRVTYYASSATTVADRERFLGTSSAVIAIEEGWYERVRAVRLYRYVFAPESFECLDAGAGYFISRVAVAPTLVEAIDDPVRELESQGVELRQVPTLWALRDAVVASTLQFSMIRMRNAQSKGA